MFKNKSKGKSNISKEHWKDVVGFEGLYKVSSYGNVKSVKRQVNNGSNLGMMLPERILKPTKVGRGYLQVSLRKNLKTYPKYVHRLVAEAFIPNDTNQPTINHIDGNKENNNIDNLEFCSYSSNNQHAYNAGLHKRDENHYKAKLSNNQVLEIKKNGKYTTYENIADKYGVSRATIRDILIGNTFKHLN